MRQCLFLAAAIATTIVSTAANAAVTIDIQESGPDVIATTSGSLDLSGLSGSGSIFSGGGFVAPSFAIFSSTGTASFGDLYTGLSGPSSFGSSSYVMSSASSGDFFLFAQNMSWVGVNSGYTSGSSIAASTTFSSTTLASLGLTPGTYVFTVPSDTITLLVGTISGGVPEPSTWAMMLLGFGLIGGAMRSAKRKQNLGVSYA